MLDTYNDHNPDNPINQEQYSESFESDVLSECLDYAKEFNDYELIEKAIVNQETIIEKAVSEIEFLIDSLNHNTMFKNRMYKLRTLLKSNQK